jgi:hypothetical protein
MVTSAGKAARRPPTGEEEGLGGMGLPGSPTGLSCPVCGGVLGERAEGDELKLECRIGHVVVLEALLDAKAAAVEDALWAAVRALDEKAALWNGGCPSGPSSRTILNGRPCTPACRRLQSDGPASSAMCSSPTRPGRPLTNRAPTKRPRRAC